MYCQNCGSQVKPELNYCSRCGMRVARGETETQKSIAQNLSSAIGYIGGFGLLGFIFVTLVMVKNGIHPAALTFIAFFYLAALFGICFLTLQQIKSLHGKSREGKPEFQPGFQNEQFKPVDTAQLEAPAEPFMSVTESTTRTLDEVMVKRN